MTTQVYVAGIGMTRFGRHLDQSIKQLTRAAVGQALTDAGCDKALLEAAFFANSTQGHMEGQHMIRGELALRAMGVCGIPMVNVENACASASTAFHLAVNYIKAGAADIVLAVGAEKMFSMDKALSFSAFDSAWDVEDTENGKAKLMEMGRGIEPPSGSISLKPYSVFMDIYASMGRMHMREYGTTQRQFAAVSSKNHAHSVHNGLSQYRDAYDVESILHAPPITYPLTLPMCSPISDGAAAAILCSESGLARLKGPRSRAIHVLASVIQTGSDRAPVDLDRHLVRLGSRKAYEQAGVGPGDISVAEVHDATAIGEVIQSEVLGLCATGMGGPAAERGETSIGGRIPINPSGGLESKGHPIGATGLGQIYELVLQLRGEAGPRQVRDARIALAENGGGLHGYEEAVACITILGKVSSAGSKDRMTRRESHQLPYQEDYSAMTTIPESILAKLIANRAEADPNLEVVTFEGGDLRPDEVRTYRDLWEHGQYLARVLVNNGVRPGEHFALLMANHPEFLDAMVAASITGTVFVPIDPRSKGEKLAFMLNNAKCKGVFAADYALDNLMAVRGACSGLSWVVGLKTDEGTKPISDYPGVVRYEAALPRSLPDLEIATRDPNSAMQLIFTSGTTGDPKAIVMTHRRYYDTATAAARLFGYAPDDRPYSGLPLTHANAQIVTVGASLVLGLRSVLSRRFTKSRLWDITRRHGCTTFTLLGGMTNAIYSDPPKPTDTENPVRFVVSAGMPAGIWESFEKRFDLKILEFYGTAEGGLAAKPIDSGPVGSIGKLASTLKHRIIDEDGEDCLPGVPGELLIRPADGSPFKVEYFGNHEASAKKCEDGWLHTGDVVRADAEGWLFFEFRLGDGIRHNGEFINPASIEKTIAESGLVDDVFVYGVTAASGAPGEKDVVATVVPKEVEAFDPQQVFHVCRATLAANSVPSYVQIVPEIPKTTSEKPQKRFLIEMFERCPENVFPRLPAM